MSKKKIVFLTASAAMMVILLGAALFGQTTQKGDLYRYLSIFSEVFSLVRSNYVEEATADQLVDGAFSGVTDAIDEYSYYVSPQQMAEYKKFVPEEASGIGLVVSKRFGYGYVISTVAGSPAEKAGVDAGDFIETIDGRPTQRMPVWQIQSSLQRADGKPVKLRLLRGALGKRDDLEISRRDYLAERSALSYFGSVAYIKVPFFSEGSAERFASQLVEVRKAGKRKLILDLRGNAGGSVEEAIEVADHLLGRGTITTLEGRRLDAKRWDADGETGFDGELQVLTDSSTAAGAEIVAAGIRGNARGKLVGIPTYGKAIVQKLIALPSGGGLFMTVGHYTTPDLKTIKEQGIKPDVMVDLTANALADEEEREKQDLILQKALSLFGETNLKAAA